MIMTFRANLLKRNTRITLCCYLCNESIVDRVSFLGTVDIFQMALCLSELTVWLSYAVTLHWLSRYGSPSNELMFHPVSYHSSAVPQDAQSTKTHAARVTAVTGTSMKISSVIRLPNTPPVLSFQFSWPDSLLLSGTCLAETLKSSIFNYWFEVALLRSTFRVDFLSVDAGASMNS